MKFGIFGTGMAGQALAGRLTGLGHGVMLGTRNVAETLARSQPGEAGAPTFGDWLKQLPPVKLGTFAEAAAYGEMLINATNGTGSLAALRSAGEANLNGKTLMDLANPLDFSQGMPPTLFVKDTDSLGEQLQRAFPKVKMVKTLNTMNASVMIHPAAVANGDHSVFIGGNDAGAKAAATEVLRNFGWTDIVDLGDLTSARGMEMILPLWLQVMGNYQSPLFNFKIAR